jgi:hypothetical protein
MEKSGLSYYKNPNDVNGQNAIFVSIYINDNINNK